MENQQAFIRDAMGQLGMNRRVFAEKLGISKRAVDTWLLPDDSKGLRKLVPEMQIKIYDALREASIGKRRNINEAKVNKKAGAVFCDMFNFRFPTIYRFSGHYYGLDVKPDLETSAVQYSLSPDPSNSKITIFVEDKPRPIRHLEKGIDTGWLFVNEHVNLDAADGYMRGKSEVDPETNTSWLYKFEGRLITLSHMPKPAEAVMDCLIFYSSDFYPAMLTTNFPCVTNQVTFESVNGWELVIGPDGKEYSGPLYPEDLMTLEELAARAKVKK